MKHDNYTWKIYLSVFDIKFNDFLTLNLIILLLLYLCICCLHIDTEILLNMNCFKQNHSVVLEYSTHSNDIANSMV